MKRPKQDALCVSVFKNGEEKTTKRDFTQVWIELINRIEKGKQASGGKRGEKP